MRLGVLALTVTCRPRADALVDVTLDTDAATYVARGEGSTPRRQYAFTIIARLTNRRAEPIALERCSPDSPAPLFDVQAVAGVPSAGASSPVHLCVGHDHPLIVLANRSGVDTLRLTGPNAFGDTPPMPTDSPVGQLRLRYRLRRADAPARGGPEQSILSNVVVVDTLDGPARDA